MGLSQINVNNNNVLGIEQNIQNDVNTVPSSKAVAEALMPITGYVKDGYYLDAGGNEIALDGVSVTPYIPVSPSTAYVFYEGNLPYSVYSLIKIWWYKASYSKIDYNSVYSSGWTGNSPASAAYVRLSVKSNDTTSYLKQGDSVIWSLNKTIPQNITDILNDTSSIKQVIAFKTFDLKVIKMGYCFDDSGNEIADERFGITDYIPILYNQRLRYGIFPIRDNKAKLILYDKNKNYKSYVSYGSFFNNDGSIAYIRFSIALDCHNYFWLYENLNICVYEYNPYLGNYEYIGFYLNQNNGQNIDKDFGISGRIPIKSSTTYTWKSESISHRNSKLILYNSSFEMTNYYSDYGADGTTFTTGVNDAYVSLSFGMGDIDATLVETNTGVVIWKRKLDATPRLNKLEESISDYNDIKNAIGYIALSSNIVNAIQNHRIRITKAIQNNELTFGWVTDVHLSDYNLNVCLKRLYTLAKCAKSSPMKFLVFGGDLVSGENTVNLDLSTMIYGEESLKDNFGLDVLMCRGNHDGGHRQWKSVIDAGNKPTYNDIVTNKEWFNMTSKNLDVIYDAANPMGAYYYKDYENEKIRIIILNMYDWDGEDTDGVYNAMYHRACITQKMITWFINHALNFSEKGNDKSNWGVIVFSHDGSTQDDDCFDGFVQMNGILKAFNTGGSYSSSYSRAQKPAIPAFNINADFTAQGAIPCKAYIHGHTHRDRVVYVDGIPHISTAAAHPDNTEDMPAGSTLPMPRVVGEVNEYCWDTISVGSDYIDLYRFGAVEENKTEGDRIVNQGIHTVAVNGTTNLTSKLSGTLTWGIYSVSPGYYIPISGGVPGEPHGTEVVHASISNGVVTGISIGEATAFAQDEAGNKEFFCVVITA